MKLIYAAGACSFSVHILLEELGLKYEAQAVSLDNKTVLNRYNPEGYVPVLVLNDGYKLTEATAILQWVAEKEAGTKYFPAAGTFERAECMRWLVFASTELHQKVGPLFHKEDLTPKFKKDVEEKVDHRLKYLDEHLGKNRFLMGNQYTIADMYTLAILRICEHVKIDLKKYPSVSKFKDMMDSMPVVAKLTQLEKQEAAALEK